MRVFYFEPRDFKAKKPRVKDKIEAMNSLGWKSFECEYQVIIKNWGLERGLLKIEQAVSDFQPDIILVEKAPEIKAEFLKRIKGKSSVVMWYGDQRGQIVHPCVQQKIGGIDALGITNSEQIDFYKRLGIPQVFEWHCAANQRTMRPYPEIKSPVYDVVFGGNNYLNSSFPDAKNRCLFVRALSSKFRLMTYGTPNWGKGVNTKPGVVDGDYGKALYSAKTTLGYNNFSDIHNYYDWRIFQSLAVGRMHITKYIRGMERDFENHKYLAWFTTPEEGLEMFSFYLANPDKADAVGREGRRLFLEKHTWEARFAELPYAVSK